MALSLRKYHFDSVFSFILYFIDLSRASSWAVLRKVAQEIPCFQIQKNKKVKKAQISLIRACCLFWKPLLPWKSVTAEGDSSKSGSGIWNAVRVRTCIRLHSWKTPWRSRHVDNNSTQPPCLSSSLLKLGSTVCLALFANSCSALEISATVLVLQIKIRFAASYQWQAKNLQIWTSLFSKNFATISCFLSFCRFSHNFCTTCCQYWKCYKIHSRPKRWNQSTADEQSLAAQAHTATQDLINHQQHFFILNRTKIKPQGLQMPQIQHDTNNCSCSESKPSEKLSKAEKKKCIKTPRQCCGCVPVEMKQMLKRLWWF